MSGIHVARVPLDSPQKKVLAGYSRAVGCGSAVGLDAPPPEMPRELRKNVALCTPARRDRWMVPPRPPYVCNVEVGFDAPDVWQNMWLDGIAPDEQALCVKYHIPPFVYLFTRKQILETKNILYTTLLDVRAVSGLDFITSSALLDSSLAVVASSVRCEPYSLEV